MATLKIKKPSSPDAAGPRAARAPVRGLNSQSRPRPTLAEKEAQRSERTRPAMAKPTAPAAPSRAAQAKPNTAFSPQASAPTLPEQRPVPSPAASRPAPAPVKRARAAVVALPDDEIRLSKRMSELGIASRREADDWIAKGWVRVDGQVVNQLGSRVRPGQLITVDTPAKFHQARKVTVLLNKPVGYVSGQAEDGHEPAWVLIRAENQWREDTSGIRFRREHTRGLAPAGRLDIDSVGLLVMTQDGRVAKQLIGEDSHVEKEYLVRVASNRPGQALHQTDLTPLRHGLVLDDVPLKPAQVEWIHSDQLRVVLQEGRKRQIRRMCEAVGLQVVGLQRIRIGQIALGSLPPGQWRFMRLDETFGD